MKGVYIFHIFLSLLPFSSLILQAWNYKKKIKHAVFFPRGRQSCKKFLSGVAWESDAKATLLSASYERHFTFYCTDQRM
jgi:hypothetical protein